MKNIFEVKKSLQDAIDQLEANLKSRMVQVILDTIKEDKDFDRETIIIYLEKLVELLRKDVTG